MFDEQVITDAKAHALAQFPNESCGLIVGNAYIPCENVAEYPEKDFAIDDAITEPYILGGTLQGVLHSHPFEVMKEKSCPSANDMRSQIALNVPFGIIDTDGTVVNDPYWWGDFKLDEPIIGHQFHHGIEDCYLPVRRFFWQRRGIKLADIPRDAQWWNSGESLYLAYFESMGFRKITPSDIRDGDVMLGKINSKVVNHAAVYLNNSVDGKGLLLHHLAGRLSRREPAGPYLARADMIVRYDAD